MTARPTAKNGRETHPRQKTKNKKNELPFLEKGGGDGGEWEWEWGEGVWDKKPPMPTPIPTRPHHPHRPMNEEGEGLVGSRRLAGWLAGGRVGGWADSDLDWREGGSRYLV